MMRINQESVFVNLVNNGQMARILLKTEGIIPLRPDNFMNSNLMTGFASLNLDTNRTFEKMISWQNYIMPSPL